MHTKVTEHEPNEGGGKKADRGSTSDDARPSSASLPLDVALHEIANSLTAVLGWLETASASADSETRSKIERAVTRVRQSHRLARSALGTRPANEGPRSLVDTIEEVAGALTPRTKAKQARLECHLFPALASVSVTHPDRLTQILTNLSLNAIEHARAGDTIRITADVAQPGFVVISVVDEGPGVPEALRGGLFKKRATGRADGVGIGLTHSAELARRSQGSLRLAPSTVGAHFVLTWPFVGSAVRSAVSDPRAALPTLVEADAAERIAARHGQDADGHAQARAVAPHAVVDASGIRPKAAELSGKKILILEDDPAIAEMLEAFLSARGATATVIRRRRELDEALLRGPFDGVLLDLSPIADDAAGVLRLVRQKNPDGRIVLVSGSIECLPLLTSDIVVSWVQKPFEMRDVVRALTSPLSQGDPSLRVTA